MGVSVFGFQLSILSFSFVTCVIIKERRLLKGSRFSQGRQNEVLNHSMLFPLHHSEFPFRFTYTPTQITIAGEKRIVFVLSAVAAAPFMSS